MPSSLEDDLSCPVCCELYKDPQLISCGHTFCQLCLKKHWNVNTTRTCPVCRRVSLQEPVPNLALRNTTESYQKEQEEEKNERESEDRCPEHGEKMLFFCKTDDEVICSKCKKESHRAHRVQHLAHAVQQRKDRIKAALLPAEKVLQSLKNGSSQKSQAAEYIQSQAQQAEKQIKAEFEKFHRFLREQEKARLAALKKEVGEKRGSVEEKIKREILFLSDRLKEVEEQMESGDAEFLQNYNFVLQRAQFTMLDSGLNSENLINMGEHVGNLGHHVWEKMRDIFHYYPILLDPNSAPGDFLISEDLASVRMSSSIRQSPIPFHGNRLVLGSEGYDDGFHCWNIEVGDSKHWTLGVCQRSADRNVVQPLSPERGFWGLRRHGESYTLLTTYRHTFRINRKPGTVQVQLGWCYTLNNLNVRRMVRFMDGSDGSLIAFYSEIPSGMLLFPFLIPEQRSSNLRISPANPVLQLEHTFTEERKSHDPAYIICVFILGLIIGMVLFEMSKK